MHILSLVIRNDKLDKKRKEVNDFLKQQGLIGHLFLIDIKNINLGMLNKSGCTLKLMTRNGC